ncbi:unnamed protein product [Miscanthus lutarioriparius]|uniref:Sey1/RHD3-like three-helix bundle domain-containing protein n=1 Tax=Miscanthus lutarioriparius TaxID=422564 RepID=A0A811NSP7_9POAL|nr:unnamed protein product [Miscanthus lutarioriparius]
MEGKAAEARRCRGCAHSREPRRARRSLLANSVLLRLITLDRRFDDVNAAGGDYAATTTLSSARWASATQTPRPPRRRDVGTDSERGGSGAHELLRTGAILSERVLIGIGLEKSNQIQGEVPDPPSKVQTSPDKESFDKALTKEFVEEGKRCGIKSKRSWKGLDSYEGQEANKRNNNWLPPPWALDALTILGFNEFMTLLRNPLYLAVIFVVFLVGKAIWVQLDVATEFQNGFLPAILSLSTKFVPAIMNILKRLADEGQGSAGARSSYRSVTSAGSSSIIGTENGPEYSSQWQNDFLHLCFLGEYLS